MTYRAGVQVGVGMGLGFRLGSGIGVGVGLRLGVGLGSGLDLACGWRCRLVWGAAAEGDLRLGYNMGGCGIGGRVGRVGVA